MPKAKPKTLPDLKKGYEEKRKRKKGDGGIIY